MAPSTLVHFRSLTLLLLLLPLLPTVFTYSNDECKMLPESPLLAQLRSDSWTSPSGEFAFGFHILLDGENFNHFLLALWFKKIKVQTIVWSANGNKPAPEGSELKLNSYNEFVLNNPQGVELWKVKTNGYKPSCIAMLDNGNLVIRDKYNNPVWESFKEPTDTIFPGQILHKPSKLRSHTSKTSHFKGRFQLYLQKDGNLVLYSLSMPSEDIEKPYFASMTLRWDSQLIFNEAGYIYIQDAVKTYKTYKTYNLTRQDPGSRETFYHMARIDHDGVRLYKHQRDNTSDGSCPSSWTIVQGIPDDIYMWCIGQ
ncbi:G-type lectin S-receptor-like serine/threonine-protein kinase LECRK3 [Quercus suber]|uniref:G-type lectin s-receptor-like serine/threonine-protein kinase lecrk3 n=1 Tax=Quercus suber TaxID=58331 RepID=A0AAW0ISN3_QUESU